MSQLLNLRPVLADPGVPIQYTGTLDITELVVGDQTFAARSKPTWDLMLCDVGDGVLASGMVEYECVATCARCLVEFPMTLRAHIDVLFYKEETLDNDGDPLPSMDDESNIDLDTELLGELIVRAPFAPLHDKKCEGLCVSCGCDLNVESCTCDDDIDVSHPFANLGNLISDEPPSPV